MSTEIVIIEFKDLERPYPTDWGRYWPDGTGDTAEPITGEYHHSKTLLTKNEGGGLIGVTIDNKVYRNHTPRSGLIQKTEEVTSHLLYWYYELLDHKERLNTNPIQPNEELSYHEIPYPADNHEHVIDHNTQSDTYGSYYPYPWTHLEVSDAIFVQGLLFVRPTDGGDNLKRSYMNEVLWLNVMATAVGATEENLLGIAYIPGTDRLNT